MYNLRVVKYKKGVLLLCPNGSIAKVDSKILARLLTEFTTPKSFKGKNGVWNTLYADMEAYPGQTLAFVERDCLTIVNDQLFAELNADS